MNFPSLSTTKVTTVDNADDRFISINGPAINKLPDWGITVHTTDIEYHLHQPILYEVHYRLKQFVLIHMFNRATGRIGVGGSSIVPWVAEPKVSCIVPPGLSVRIVQETPLEFIAVGITESFFEKVAGFKSNEWTHLEDFYKPDDYALTVLFAEMRRSLLSDPVGNGQYLDALTRAMLIRFIECNASFSAETETNAESLAPSLVRVLSEYIESNLSTVIHVNDLVELSQLSRSHFSRAFSNTFGMPAQKYILSRRVAFARQQITDSSLSMTDISMACGFANPSHLTTAFKNELGLTPTEYRDALNNHAA